MGGAPLDGGTLGAALTRYFAGEKGETLIFFAVGFAAIGAAVLLLVRGGGWRHMAWPLALLALPEIAVAASVYLRTDGQVAALRATLAQSPAAVVRAEVPRMEQVMARFHSYAAVELALAAIGAACALAGRGRPSLQAVGLGLFVQASLLFTLDQFAERRGAGYLAALRPGKERS